MFSRRAGWELEPNELARRLEARRSAGLRVVDLCESNPTRCGLVESGRALASALAELACDPRVARYEPDPRGHLDARRAVAADLAERGAPLDPAQIVLTAGTSEAYAHLFRLLADPGERVLVPQPSYPLFDFLAELEGLESARYPLALDSAARSWRIDFDELRAAAADARALVVVHPGNPTGARVHPEDVLRLRALCVERGLALISDEVFADYWFEPAAHARTLLRGSADGPLQFALSGASKMLGLPQLKVAWIAAAGPRSLREEALARLEVIADTYLTVGPPQLLLPRLLAQRERLQVPIAARVRANRTALAARTKGTALELLPADGGWSSILRGEFDDERLALELLDREGVLVHPGHFFELPPGHLVVSLLPTPEEFTAGIEALLGSQPS